MNRIGISLAAWSPWFFFAATAIAAARSHGAYSLRDLCLLTFGLVVFTAGSFRERKLVFSETGFALLWVLFLNRLAQHPTIIYADNNLAMKSIRFGLYLCFAVSILFMGLTVWSPARARAFLARVGWPCLVLLMLCQVGVLWASPDPHIDVFTIAREACTRFLSGENPYGVAYTDIYNGGYGYRPVLNYPPAVLVLASLFQAGLRDLRFTYVFASIGTVGILYRLGALRGLNKNAKLLCCLLWVSVPSTLFVLEQAWVDMLLVFATALALWALWRRRWFLGGLALGFHASIKQYGFLFGVIVAVALFRSRKVQAVVWGCGGASLVVGIFFLPFYLWNPSALYTNLVTDVITQPIRMDALTWRAALFHLIGMNPASSLFTIVTLAVLMIFLFLPKKDLWSRTLSAVVIFHAFLFVCARQAFCNYYYYLTFLILIAGLSLLESSPGTASRGTVTLND